MHLGARGNRWWIRVFQGKTKKMYTCFSNDFQGFRRGREACFFLPFDVLTYVFPSTFNVIYGCAHTRTYMGVHIDTYMGAHTHTYNIGSACLGRSKCIKSGVVFLSATASSPPATTGMFLLETGCKCWKRLFSQWFYKVFAKPRYVYICHP